MADTDRQRALGGVPGWQIALTQLVPAEVLLRAVWDKLLPPRRGDMTCRERVKRAIEFSGPDRIPHQRRDFWFLFHFPPQSWQPQEGYAPYVHPGAVLTRSWRWEKRRGTRWLKEDRVAVDEFGTLWRASGRTSLGEVKKGALEEDWSLLDGYRLPDMKDPARFRRSMALSQRLAGDRYLMGCDTHSIRERFQFLRGFENAMTDVLLYPEETRRLLAMLTDMTLDLVHGFKEAGANGFMLVDDWGTQEGPLMSPEHFREFFVPCYQRIAQRCHELGMHCGMHSCGDIRKLVSSMREAGLDFLQLDSPNMCGLRWLAENAAGKICLFCSVDIQQVYPTNDLDLIRRATQEMIFCLGDHQGGLVAWPYVEAWVIGVGIRAVRLEERLFETWGRYPLDAKAMTM